LLAGNNNNHPLPDRNQPTSQEIEQQITAATKMIAASKDFGRRAVSVTQLGDSRAIRRYLAIYDHDGSIVNIFGVHDNYG
jgi:hypothetical protein